VTERVQNVVSTVIPVYNRPEMLRQAVDSVLEQTYRPLQIIIADDGSSDKTPEVGRALSQKMPEIVRYVAHSNQGPGPTRELGRQVANGEFVQYLDSDDRLLPNKFADQVNALKDHPECGIAYGLTRLVDAMGETLAEPFKWTNRDIPELFPGLLVDLWWCTHTPLYRRTLTDKIGSWSDMRWSQDWEYDARAGAMNTKLVNCNTYVSEHVHHDGVRQTSNAAWSTDLVRLRNRVQLLSALWANARKAGVPEAAPERQHFSRWCFRIARQCAAQGLQAEMASCLTIACESAGANGSGRRGIGMFHTASRILGAKAAGRASSLVEGLRRGSGTATMDQSFSGQIADLHS
jgi:Glycosyl transferase family 2